MKKIIFAVPLMLFAGAASADCIEEIDSFIAASLPPGAEAESMDTRSDEQSVGAGEEKDATEIVQEMVESGPTVEDQGGTTKYPSDGPALPTENWFGYPPEKKEVAEKLADAKAHADAGDEAACMAALEEAKVLDVEEELDTDEAS